jgi:hypothetical protein
VDVAGERLGHEGDGRLEGRRVGVDDEDGRWVVEAVGQVVGGEGQAGRGVAGGLGAGFALQRLEG